MEIILLLMLIILIVVIEIEIIGVVELLKVHLLVEVLEQVLELKKFVHGQNMLKIIGIGQLMNIGHLLIIEKDSIF